MELKIIFLGSLVYFSLLAGFGGKHEALAGENKTKNTQKRLLHDHYPEVCCLWHENRDTPHVDELYHISFSLLSHSPLP